MLPEQYVAIKPYHNPPSRPCKLSPQQIETFIKHFGSRIVDFYQGEVYYVGKLEDGQYMFTNKDSWIKYRQQLKRDK